MKEESTERLIEEIEINLETMEMCEETLNKIYMADKVLKGGK